MKKPKQLRTTFNSYSVLDQIGEGGCGTVFGAKQEGGQSVAIKILDSSKANSEKLKRFENEYRFCSRNKHPNIITVLDNGLTDDESPFFVMPLYKGSIRRHIGKLPPRDALTIFEKIIDGVEAAHKSGVFHRDLKPENILSNDAITDLVVADFGIARFEEEEIYTAVETKEGTRLANFQYAAPEQRTRGQTVDKRADIYALGLILNELFTGQLALGTNFKTITSVTSDYPYLDSLVDRMLQQNPDHRFQSIDDIKKELIARGEQHVSLQKISSLKETVIPAGELDDPIVAEPMAIVNARWDGGNLGIELNHQANPTWRWAFTNMGNYGFALGYEPERFQFIKNTAWIRCGSDDAQMVVNYFKDWLPIANGVYRLKLKEDMEESERKQRAELQRRIKEEEESARVNQSLKF